MELTDRILNADGACYDLIYSVDDTPFLKMCRSLTDQRADGLGMLLSQAARQFELWTGFLPDPFEQFIDFGRTRCSHLTDIWLDFSDDGYGKKLPLARLGVVGGGQLARMLAPACNNHDVQMTILDPSNEFACWTSGL